jgi:hypothetical protein
VPLDGSPLDADPGSASASRAGPCRETGQPIRPKVSAAGDVE